MGGVLPVLKFVGAIFIGAGAGASAAYVFAVNAARIGLLALAAKAFTPKVDLTEKAQTKTLTIRDPVAPQVFIYGEDLVSGPLVFGNTAGTENRDLLQTIVLAGHECDSIQSYRIDDTDIPLTSVSGSEDGDVNAGRFNGVASVERSLGTSTQSAQSKLTTTFPSLFNSAHTGRGWCFTTWELNLIEGQEDAFETTPQNFRALVRGRKLYDPRLDSTNGGSGLHRLADPSTWEWSSNPALCLADFLRDDKFGLGEEDDRIDWPLVIAAADICDQTVSIPGGTQTRYTCNATFTALETRGAVRDELLNAMLGRMVFSQGVWKMWAGAAITPDVTITEANLRGGIQLQANAPGNERFNRVRGKFIDSERNYVAAAYPEQRSSTYETQDGGDVLEKVADWTHCNNTYEAQRKSIHTLRRSRNQRVLVFEGNMSCFRLQPGTTVLVDVAELGFTGEKFFITEWAFTPDGIDLTLVEENDTVWTDPTVGEYTTRSATGTLTFADIGVPAVTNLAVVAQANGNRLTWTDPPRGTYDYIEIWGARGQNLRSAATVVGTSAGQEFFHPRSGQIDEWFYWTRVRRGPLASNYTPNLTTTTVTTTNLSDGRPALNYDPDFDFSTGLSNINYWTSKVFGDASSATFNSTGGVGNSAYVALGAGSTSGQNPFSFLSSTRRFRASAPTLEVVFRYRTASAGAQPNFFITLRPYDEETGGTAGTQINWPQNAGGADIPGTNNAWQTIRIPVDIPDSAQGRFFDIDFGFGPPGGGADIDSVFVYPASRAFDQQDAIDNVGSTKRLAGLVPESDDNFNVLNARGEWYEKPLGRRDARYLFDTNTTTTTTPDGGSLKFNSGTVSSISEMAIRVSSDDGITMTEVIERLRVGSRVVIEEVDRLDTIQEFEVVGARTNNTTWWRIAVRPIHGGLGILPADGERCVVNFFYSNAPNGWEGRIANTSVTIASTDLDSILRKESGGAGETWTIPANSSQAWAIGSMFGGVNRGGGDLSLAITTDTLRNVRTGATGTQTIPDDKTFVCLKVATTEWFVAISP